MVSARRLWLRLQTLFRRQRLAQRLDDEMQFHLDEQIAENIAAGMNREEARYAALRTFGNLTVLKEETRYTWGWTWLEELVRNLRYAARALRRAPAFTFAAILVMALGIGATTTLFTVVRSVLLKPLPFDDPERLVMLYEQDSDSRFPDNIVAGGTFADWKEQTKSFTQMALLRDASYNLSGERGQLPEHVNAYVCSWNLFPTLGVDAAYGRLFDATDDWPEAGATVVLTWRLWRRRYGGDPSIIGKTILLDAKKYTVNGVLPAWFTYPDKRTQLWTPVYHEKSPFLMRVHGGHNFNVIARLKNGVTVSQARAELQTLQKNIHREHPDEPVFDSANVRPLLESVVKDAKTPLYVLLGATGCLLLIACLNVANLLIARAATRRKEVAIRASLGGSRWRLISEQFTESVVLSLAGGSLGLAFAYWGIEWLVRIRQDMARADAVHVDGLVLFFAVGITSLSGFLAGSIPAFHASGSNALDALQDSSRTHSGGQARTKLRKVLLAFEVGLTVVLLIGGGLLLKSYRELRSTNLGCATHNVLTMGLSLPSIKYKSPIQISAFYWELLERLRQMPGVQAAGLATVLPGQGLHRSDAFTIHEQPPLPKGQFLAAAMRAVDPGYFVAMEISLLRGRTFNNGERLGQTNVAIIDESFAKRYFANEDAIGKHIDDPNGGPQRSYEIVGIVGNTLSRISEPAEPTMYFPLYSGEDGSVSIAIRSQKDATSLALPIQKLIAQVDSDLPVSDVLTMEQIIGNSTVDIEFSAIVILSFAIASLVLAAVGLFGVLSYLVTQRTNELGIRIALGAHRKQILRLVLIDGLQPACIGLALGLAAGSGAAQLIRSMLYGVHPLDFYVFTFVALLSIIVAVCASALPAWRAARLDPMQALRNE